MDFTMDFAPAVDQDPVSTLLRTVFTFSRSPRSEWDGAPVYRIPDRDKKRGPSAKYKEGDWITYKRVVVRVGYEFGVHSVSKEAWLRCGLEITAERSGVSIRDVARVINALDKSSPFKGIKNEIYNRLVRPLTRSGINRNIRAMWFYDLEHEHLGQVEKSVTRLTGVRDPGWSDEDGGCPPFLTETNHQMLYKVIEPTFGHLIMVYPDDVIESTTEGDA